MPGGFKESPLKLNAGLGQLDQWNEDTIKARAERLAGMAAEVWAAPSLSIDVLANYQAKESVPAGFSIDDHPHLLASPMRQVFEAFRKEVLALNPCVSEEFRKLYVSYKPETNFVYVVPQAKRFRLSLNMAFPRSMIEGSVNVTISDGGAMAISSWALEHRRTAYVMGLVRQSFGQMGNGRMCELCVLLDPDASGDP
jgi:predicted transport protein